MPLQTNRWVFRVTVLGRAVRLLMNPALRQQYIANKTGKNFSSLVRKDEQLRQQPEMGFYRRHLRSTLIRSCTFTGLLM